MTLQTYMCKGCNTLCMEEETVWAECCGMRLCKDCWKEHRCDKLTDMNGRLVRVGDKMKYLDNYRIWQVSEITPSFTRGQTCVGELVLKKRLDGKRYVMRTRLMEVIK